MKLNGIPSTRSILSALALWTAGAIASLSLSSSADAGLDDSEAAIKIATPVVLTGVGAGTQTRGYTFTLDRSRSLTHLGLYQYSESGLTVARQIGLWNAAGTLVASVTLPIDTPTDGLPWPEAFFYGELPAPVTLSAEEVYTAGVWYDVDNSPGLAMMVDFTTIPGFSYGNAVETGAPGGAFAKPTIPRLDRPHAYIGPNLRFALESPPRTWTAGAGLAANEKPDDAGDPVNPNPTVTEWSYGYRPDLAGTEFTLFTAGEHSDSFIDLNDPIEGFYVFGGPSVPSVMVNTGTDPYTMSFGAGVVGPSEMFTHGGPPGPTAFAVVRFTAPAAGLYDVSASFRSIHSGDTEGHIVINGVSMFDSLLPVGGSVAPALPGVSLAAGDLIDFVVGAGTAFGGDSTAFDATVRRVSISPAVSNVVRNDQGTPADPNDDTVGLTLNVAGAAGEVSPAGWTISGPAVLAGTAGSYGVAKNIAAVPIAAFSGAGQTMVVVVADSGIPAVTASVTVVAPPPPMRRVNIDFNGKRPGDADSAGAYAGAGAAGGGTEFNGITADSTGGDDNLTVSGVGLLSDTGEPTTVGFTIGPVGGDHEPGQPTEPASLYDDYIFNNSAGNATPDGAPFTISGLGDVATADLYLYGSFGTVLNFVIPGFAGTGVPGIYNGLSATAYVGVPVTAGQITGLFGVNMTGVLGGLTITTAIPGGTTPPYTAWQQNKFGASAGNPLIAGPNADPDKDGNQNLVEYGLIGMPTSGSPATLITIGKAGGKMTLSFQRDTARNDITIRIQSSATLLPPWTDEAVSVNGAAFVPTGAATVQETGAGTLKSVTFTDSVAINSGARRFVQIKVEQ